MKTVKSLRGEDYEISFYKNILWEAYNVTIKYGAYTGLTMGLVFCIIFLDYCLAFWYIYLFFKYIKYYKLSFYLNRYGSILIEE